MTVNNDFKSQYIQSYYYSLTSSYKEHQISERETFALPSSETITLQSRTDCLNLCNLLTPLSHHQTPFPPYQTTHNVKPHAITPNQPINQRSSPSPHNHNHHHHNHTTTNTTTATTTPMPPPPPTPLLIASLGNPGPQYANTLHSAGHILLAALATYLHHPPFTPSTRLLSHALVSHPAPAPSPPYTLWQSPTYMNVSGPALALAFTNWLSSLPSLPAGGGSGGAGREGKLVILHDELEAPLGRLSVRKGGASARGHRGVKSCVEALRGRGVGEGRIWRVGVGVGRCEGRGREEVSGWLLREMDGWEGRVLRGRAGELGRVVGGIAEGRV